MKHLIILFLLFTNLLLSQDYTEIRFQKRVVEGGEYFGARVLFFNEYLLFSANQEDDMGPNSGSVYAFKYINDEWKSSKIRLPYFHSDAFFGLSLASMDNLVFIGAPRHKNINNVTTGGVLIYEYSDNTFNYKDRIIPGDYAIMSTFGSKIKILNNELIISASEFNGNQSGAGRVFIYSKENDAWQVSDTLKADMVIKNSFFAKISM